MPAYVGIATPTRNDVALVLTKARNTAVKRSMLSSTRDVLLRNRTRKRKQAVYTAAVTTIVLSNPRCGRAVVVLVGLGIMVARGRITTSAASTTIDCGDAASSTSCIGSFLAAVKEVAISAREVFSAKGGRVAGGDNAADRCVCGLLFVIVPAVTRLVAFDCYEEDVCGVCLSRTVALTHEIVCIWDVSIQRTILTYNMGRKQSNGWFSHK